MTHFREVQVLLLVKWGLSAREITQRLNAELRARGFQGEIKAWSVYPLIARFRVGRRYKSFVVEPLRCSKCQKVKLNDKFYRNSSRRSGRDATCKKCRESATPKSTSAERRRRKQSGRRRISNQYVKKRLRAHAAGLKGRDIPPHIVRAGRQMITLKRQLPPNDLKSRLTQIAIKLPGWLGYDDHGFPLHYRMCTTCLAVRLNKDFYWIENPGGPGHSLCGRCFSKETLRRDKIRERRRTTRAGHRWALTDQHISKLLKQEHPELRGGDIAVECIQFRRQLFLFRRELSAFKRRVKNGTTGAGDKGNTAIDE